MSRIPSQSSPLARFPVPSSAQNDLAQALAAHQAGQFAVAENLYRRILRHSPDNVQVLSMLGALACATGRMESGVATLQRAVRLDPRESAAQFNLAQALEHLGRLDEARQCYERIVQMAPQDAESSMHAGRLNMRCRLPERAVDFYRRAAQLRPDMAQLSNLLGVALHAAGRISEALTAFENAAQGAPANADIQSNLGHLLRLNGRLQEALTVLERGLTLDPRHAALQINLANTLLDLNRAEQSLPYYERAIAARPQDADFHASHGMALEALGRKEEALSAYRAALALNADHPDARFSLGLHALALHDYSEGWRGYEYRWIRKAVPFPLRKFPQPRWRGEPLHGKRLLLHTEQGIGDEIMFAGIYAELLTEAAHCVIECNPKLASLFRSSFPAASIVPIHRDRPDWLASSLQTLASAGEADLQIPCGSLPALRRRSAAEFPRHNGYLRADDASVANWRARLQALGPGLKVGLSWRGGTQRTGILRRSLSLQQLLPLLNVPDVHFVSLQYTECADELAELTRTTGAVVHHWQEAIDDYGETAALVSALDLTISVCTAVVHLGGALAAPVWVLAPRVPEWRYGMEGEDMPWYPSVRMFRQDESAEWGPVIERVGVELSRQASRDPR